jgi:hypothetical protein
MTEDNIDMLDSSSVQHRVFLSSLHHISFSVVLK